jgi:hypothetical protein
MASTRAQSLRAILAMAAVLVSGSCVGAGGSDAERKRTSMVAMAVLTWLSLSGCTEAGSADPGGDSDQATSADPANNTTSPEEIEVPAYVCEQGYHLEGTQCVFDDPAAWNPTLDSLYSAEHGCQVPTCDRHGSAGFEKAGRWKEVFTTTSTTCNLLIQMADARTKKDTVFEEEFVVGPYVGTCYEDSGIHYSTAIGGREAGCKEKKVSGVVTHTVWVVDYSNPEQPNRGSGTVKVFLTNAEGGEICNFTADVTATREVE